MKLSSQTTPVRKHIILSISLIAYIISFFIIYYLLGNGMGMVVFILYLVIAAWFYGKSGGLIASAIGIVINVILGLIVEDSIVILNATIQGFIFYPLVGLGIGYLQDINSKLKKAQKEIKILKGMLPICASCKNIRNDEGYWNTLEDYFKEHSEVEFTHSLCPDCLTKLYPDLNMDET